MDFNIRISGHSIRTVDPKASTILDAGTMLRRQLLFSFVFHSSSGSCMPLAIHCIQSIIFFLRWPISNEHFHDSDKLVILSLHYSPNVAIWGLRWYPKQVEESFPGIFTASLNCGYDPQPQLNLFFTDSLCPGNFSDLFLWAVFMYIVFWAIPYYLFFFLCAQEALRRGGYITMFEDMRVRPGSDIVLHFGCDWGKELKYSLFHAFLSCIALLFGPCLWHSFHLHTIYLGLILCIAIYNGATYYFRVFAKKYYGSNIFPSSNPSEEIVADINNLVADELELHREENSIQ